MHCFESPGQPSQIKVKHLSETRFLRQIFTVLMQNEGGAHTLLQHRLRWVCVSTSCHILAMDPGLALLPMPVERSLPQKASSRQQLQKLQSPQGAHRAHVGSELAKTCWGMNVDDASNRQETSEGLAVSSAPLHCFLGLVSSPPHLWEHSKLSGSQEYNCTISQRKQLKHSQQLLFETE